MKHKILKGPLDSDVCSYQWVGLNYFADNQTRIG